jgi:hypothetical protein
MVTYPCSTRSSLRSGPLMPMKMREDGIALGLGVAEHAQFGSDRIGEHRPGDEAPLVKVGPGTTRSPGGLKKL